MRALKQHFAGKTHIIWDWNGTLLDDVDVCVEVLTTLMAEAGLAPITRDEYLRDFRFPVRDYYMELGFDLSGDAFQQLSDRFINLYWSQPHRCRLYPGAAELMDELKQDGVQSSILSAAQQSALEQLLGQYQLRHHFEHVAGVADNLANGKLDRGLELLDRINLDKDKIILVGDTDHDLEVGRELGLDVLLLADGHQCYNRLASLHDRVLASRYSNAQALNQRR